jgi:hypothetical protein
MATPAQIAARGATRGPALGESGADSRAGGSVIDRVLAHGFDGAEEVKGGKEEVESGLANDAVDEGATRADGENTATCAEVLQGGESGGNSENDTNEANFRENVITTQTPEDLGVTSELAVGAGLDNVAGIDAVSPDLVCPNSGRKSGDAAVSGAGEAKEAAVGLSEGAGTDVVDGGVQVRRSIRERKRKKTDRTLDV